MSSLFFFSSSNHPGMTIVSHVLEGNNYKLWNKVMSTAFTARNKLFLNFFVDISIL